MRKAVLSLFIYLFIYSLHYPDNHKMEWNFKRYTVWRTFARSAYLQRELLISLLFVHSTTLLAGHARGNISQCV